MNALIDFQFLQDMPLEQRTSFLDIKVGDEVFVTGRRCKSRGLRVLVCGERVKFDSNGCRRVVAFCVRGEAGVEWICPSDLSPDDSNRDVTGLAQRIMDQEVEICL